MIDRSNCLSNTSLPVFDDATGSYGILCYSLTKSKDGMDIRWPGLEKNYDVNSDKGAKSIVWNFMKRESSGNSTASQSKHYVELETRQRENYNRNLPFIKPYKHTKYKTAVICGAGPSLDQDIPAIEEAKEDPGVCVITINSAHSRIIGDYFITSESLDITKLASYGTPINGDEEKYTNTIAHLSTFTHPSVIDKPWKELTFFTHKLYFEKQHKGIPIYFIGRHGTFDAFQFAVKTLKAKKVIFTGTDYIYTGKKDSKERVQHLSISLIEAISLFASFHGIDVWNVSQRTAFKNGVKLGTFEEAMSSDSAPRGRRRRKK